jgi:spermidine synthase
MTKRRKAQRNWLISFWLLITAAVCGAVVMGIELLGARMLSVVYGGSLTVWAAMISTTLLSLSIGYFFGGYISDRFPRTELLYASLLVAAIMVAICPYYKFVLKICYDALGIQWGTLASSAIIFFLPLGLLGAVGPFVIRLLSERGKGVGITVGVVYAVSTIGSVAGTLLTGLWLIPTFSIANCFRIAGGVIAVIGTVGLIIHLGWRGCVSCIVPIALVIVSNPAPKHGKTYIAPDGERIEIIAEYDSSHGHIMVLKKERYNLLVVNGIVQTGIPGNLSYLEKGQCLASYYFQELIPYMVDDARNCSVLIIGLAGGMTASLLKNYEMEVDSVDLDPDIIAAARKHFSFTGHAVAADGRRYLEDCQKQYDFCVIDTYSGDIFPFYLASVEAFQTARKVLKPNGVLVINFIGSPQGKTFASLYRTLQEVFPHILALKGELSTDVQTITVFAAARQIKFNAGWLDYLNDFTGVDPITKSIAQLTVSPQRTDGIILTDDYNPIDSMRNTEALRWRERTVLNIGENVIF